MNWSTNWRFEYYRTLVDAPLEILVEQEAHERPGYVRGTDRRYVPVEIPGNEADLGKLVNGVGEQTFDRFLRATRIR